jgi:hypothetical protein
MRVGSAPAPVDLESQHTVASVTTTDGRTFKEVKALRFLPGVGDGLIIGDRVLLLYADGSETVPLDSLGSAARKRLGLSFLANSADDAHSAAEKRRATRAAKFWADVKLHVSDWRELDASPRLLDSLMRKNLGETLDERERARALAKWRMQQWAPWAAKNVDPATGKLLPSADPLPPAPY